jgi:hypothetical protein
VVLDPKREQVRISMTMMFMNLVSNVAFGTVTSVQLFRMAGLRPGTTHGTGSRTGTATGTCIYAEQLANSDKTRLQHAEG